MYGLAHGVACQTERAPFSQPFFGYNFASETPIEFIFSQLVDFANVTLLNA